MATIDGPPLLCVLCINPAEDDFALYRDQRPRVRLCNQCHRRVSSGVTHLGWCDTGNHYGRPYTRCPRHHLEFDKLPDL